MINRDDSGEKYYNKLLDKIYDDQEVYDLFWALIKENSIGGLMRSFKESSDPDESEKVITNDRFYIQKAYNAFTIACKKKLGIEMSKEIYNILVRNLF